MCYASAHSGVLSFELLVQSGTYSPNHILNVTKEFLGVFYSKDLTPLTNDENKFSDKKSSYVEVISKKQLTLSGKTTFLWGYIALKLYQFDFHSQVAEVVNTITGEDLRNFYNDIILQTSRRGMVISIFGYPSQPHYISNATEVDYNNIDDFKNNASYYKAVNC